MNVVLKAASGKRNSESNDGFAEKRSDSVEQRAD